MKSQAFQVVSNWHPYSKLMRKGRTRKQNDVENITILSYETTAYRGAEPSFRDELIIWPCFGEPNDGRVPTQV